MPIGFIGIPNLIAASEFHHCLGDMGATIGHTLGLNFSNVPIHCVIDKAFESDATVLDNDSDWFVHAERVLLQLSKSVDCPIQAEPPRVVKLRYGKNFNLVIYAFHALDRLNGISRIRFEAWPRHLADCLCVSAAS